jgi:hypothetical protein
MISDHLYHHSVEFHFSKTIQQNLQIYVQANG